MTSHTLFISDLHLSEHEPHITKTFLYFLENIAPKADALYILGDFFESYVGDDDNNPLINTIIQALKKQSQNGLPIFLMHGNRDFLIGKHFSKAAGITLISDPTSIAINNQKLLLTHGDRLCTLDKAHQRFRKITGNKIIQTLFLLMPLSFRKKLAGELREESQSENRHKPTEIMDVTPSEITRVIQKHAADKLIHGHTHKPMISEKRIVLDTWEKQGSYLKIDKNGKIDSIKIDI